MRVIDYLRSRVHSRVIGPTGDKAEPLDSLRQTEWSGVFETLMRNRLLMGRYRYGLMADKPDYKNIESALQRLRLYQKTGNLEHLVDVANLCLVEFVHSKHPKKHFDSQDDGLHAEPSAKQRRGCGEW